MEWMHCNLCFSRPNANGNAGKQQLFRLTSCGHIFCLSCGCYADGTSDCCKFCKSKCSSILIGEKALRTNPEVLEYLQDPSELCEKLFKVMKFQKLHHIQSAAYHHRTISKYNRAKAYIKKLEYELKITKNALLNMSKDSYCHSESQSTISKPIFYPNSTPFKIIDAESKGQNKPSINENIPDLKHRKQSFQNELSMSTTGSMGHSDSKTDSAIYNNSLQNNSNSKCSAKFNDLQLNSFGCNSSLQDNSNSKCSAKFNDLQLNSFGRNSSLQDNSNSKCSAKFNDLQLNSFGRNSPLQNNPNAKCSAKFNNLPLNSLGRIRQLFKGHLTNE